MSDKLKDLAFAIDALNYSEMIEFANQLNKILGMPNIGLANALTQWSQEYQKAAVEENQAIDRAGRDFMARFYQAIEALLEFGPPVLGALDHYATEGAKGYMTATPADDRRHFAELIVAARMERDEFKAQHLDDEQEGEM